VRVSGTTDVEAGAAGSRSAPRPATWRIAYLTNSYPAISHSFIRNEIQAVERQGVDVLRITVRRSPTDAVDPADRMEAARTVALLEDRGRLVRAAVARLVRSPRRFIATLRLALAERQRGWLRPLAYFVEACRLAEIAEAAGITHVHVHFGTNPATVARLASRLAPLSYSVTIHGPDEFDAVAAIRLREKIADARLVVAISDYGRSQLLRWAGAADRPKIQVVRCGVGPTFRDGQADWGGLESRTLVCVARLHSQKGLPLLLEAAEQVARREAFSLRIIGDGPLREELSAQIVARGLEEHARLLGWRGSEEVKDALRRARALILPSFAEGLPIVLMEALALGRPVIATAIAGIPELVDADTGWLVRPGSAAALAQAIGAALTADTQTLHGMAEAGRRRVALEHDADANAARLVSLLRQAAESA
jgi:colanic acid/amylovoran biosynthesis glycosyltransferase